MPGNFHPPYDIKSDYGFFHVYSFTMTMAILITALLCYIKFKRRNIPAQPILGSLVIVVPIALLGASFFGKLNGSDEGVPSNWWTLFYFWVGGLSIHGAILFGSVAGVAYFSVFSRRYNVSMWVYVDVILPNVLIGQVIGRWGNFFNHELLGNVVNKSSLDWLPAFIRENCFKLIGGSPETNMAGHIVYREPIFLYESFGNFCAWAVITFVVPHIGRWLGPKPQREMQDGSKYSWRYNLKYLGRKKPDPNYISYRQWWNKSFFTIQPTLLAVQKAQNNPRQLNAIYNPKKFWITRCGVEAGMYFFLWNGIRLILETHRQDDGELFLPYHRMLDYARIGTFAAIGLVLIVIAQFILPHFTRCPGWKYEKNYADFRDLNNWQYKIFAHNAMKLGIDNTPQHFKSYLMRQAAATLGISLSERQFDELFKITDVNFHNGNSQQASLLIRFNFIPLFKAKKAWNIIDKATILIDFTIDTRIMKKPWRKFKASEHYDATETPSSIYKKFINSSDFKNYISDILQRQFTKREGLNTKNLQESTSSLLNISTIPTTSNDRHLIVGSEVLKQGNYFSSNRDVKLRL